MRSDSNGDGEPWSFRADEYGAAFPNPRARMGCPGRCIGYELTADLDFDTDGDNDVDRDDDYPDWDGGQYSAVFDGNGHTITRLTMTSSYGTSDGLFASLFRGGVIRDVGLIDASVRTRTFSWITATGILAGVNEGTISASYVQGGTITVADRQIAGGLVGANLGGRIRASYATATVSIEEDAFVSVGGLLGGISLGSVIASYSAGAILGAAATSSNIGGFVSVVGQEDEITDSYCDIQASMRGVCIGYNTSGSVTVEGKTTGELQMPDGYSGIYANWNLDLDGDSRPDNPWRFGSGSEYPTLRHRSFQHPPSPPEPPPYDPAADHPERYVNDRYGISASCEVQPGADGLPAGALIRFDLGSYRRYVMLHLSLWNGEFFMSYEALDIAPALLERDGQLATVRVITDPGRTRFLLNTDAPATNLVLGYADCHTDDDGGEFPPA